MNRRQNLLAGKGKYLFVLTLLIFLSVICVAVCNVQNDNFDVSKREVLMRRIGHELLLQSGDSTSRVLPVEKIAENEYQISFEHDLTFQPGLLVNTTRRLLAKDPLANHYVVNVLNGDNSRVVYGYVISKDKKDDIVACIGRVQPRACYRINIKYKPAGVRIAADGYLFGSLSFLAFVGFVFLQTVKPQKALQDNERTNIFTLGSVLFDAGHRKLIVQGMTIELTRTETRVLLVFAASPNQIIERSRLQKEIWEDEGVIVDRSLDMFISKLRKKLESDPNINIVVIRGKGYKLEIT
jgi:DNA-binding winged helix-turn-helix (wHTH) protein